MQLATNPSDFDGQSLSGRNRRLLHEWRKLHNRLSCLHDIRYTITRCNPWGLPIGYLVEYNIRSFSGVERIETVGQEGSENPPIYASRFWMEVVIPPNYPSLDAPAEFYFRTKDEEGRPLPHPWHPNIRFFGEMAGRVCLNPTDSYTDLVWCIERVALYLSYDLYHAQQAPPYPEDLTVAQWVTHQAEPKGWIPFHLHNTI